MAKTFRKFQGERGARTSDRRHENRRDRRRGERQAQQQLRRYIETRGQQQQQGGAGR